MAVHALVGHAARATKVYVVVKVAVVVVVAVVGKGVQVRKAAEVTPVVTAELERVSYQLYQLLVFIACLPHFCGWGMLERLCV